MKVSALNKCLPSLLRPFGLGKRLWRVGAGERALCSLASRWARLGASVWKSREEKTGGRGHYHREDFSPQQPFLPLAGSGAGPRGRKKPQKEAVWWPRVLIPSLTSFLVPPSLHFPGARARSSALPSLLPISPPLPGGGERTGAPAPALGLLGTEVPEAHALPFPLLPGGLHAP